MPAVPRIPFCLPSYNRPHTTERRFRALILTVYGCGPAFGLRVGETDAEALEVRQQIGGTGAGSCDCDPVAAAEGVKQAWVKDLVTRLNDQRRYPVLASDKGGKAKVLFHLDRSGHLVSVALIESTGDAFLDEEALAMIERAQPIPAPPAEVAAGELTFIVPVVFAPRSAAVLPSHETKPDEAALQATLKGICRGC